MLIIDAHNHVFARVKGIYGEFGQTPEELIRRMNKKNFAVNSTFTKFSS